MPVTLATAVSDDLCDMNAPSFAIGFGASLLMEWHFQRKARRADVSLNRGYVLGRTTRRETRRRPRGTGELGAAPTSRWLPER